MLDLPATIPHSRKEVSHWRNPVFHESTTRISYKSFNVGPVLAALPIVQSRGWCGKEAAEEQTFENLTSAEAVVEAARKRVKRLTSRNRIVIEGDVRPSREFEVIWWPGMFHTEAEVMESSNYDIMLLKLFIEQYSK